MALARIKNYIIILVVASAMGGCGTPFVGKGPFDATDVLTESGQKYYVGKDIITVTAELTTRKVPTLTPDLKLTTVTFTSTTVNYSKTLVPDYEKFYLIRLDATAFFDDTISLSVSPEGLLKSFDADTTGKTGSVIQNLGKVIANIQAFDVQALSASEIQIDDLAPNVMDPQTLYLNVPLFKQLPTDEVTCKQFAKTLGLGKKHQYFAETSTSACEKLDKIVAKKDVVKKLEDAIDQLLSQIADTDNLEEIQELKQEIAIKSPLRDQARTDLEKINIEYSNSFTAFAASTFSVKEEKSTFVQVYDMDELPDESNILTLVGQEKVNVISSLNNHNYQKMSQLFDTTNILLTKAHVTPLVDSQFDGQFRGNVPESAKSATNRIYFRQSYPIEVGQYKLLNLQGKTANAQLVKNSSSIHSISYRKAPVQWITYDPSYFSQRKLVLAFDDATGSLITTKTENKSSASALSGDIASTLKDMQKEYLAALENIKEGQQLTRDIELSGYTDEIEKLKKQKELIDKQVEFEGAEATAELLLEQKILKEKLSSLEAQLNLEKATSTFDQDLQLALIKAEVSTVSEQLKLDKAKATYEKDLQLAKMKADLDALKTQLELEQKEANYQQNLEIERMKVEIDLIKKRIELEGAQNQ